MALERAVAAMLGSLEPVHPHVLAGEVIDDRVVALLHRDGVAAVGDDLALERHADALARGVDDDVVCRRALHGGLLSKTLPPPSIFLRRPRRVTARQPVCQTGVEFPRQQLEGGSMKRLSILIAAAALSASALAQQPDIARGRYVAIIGGCNDCHTAGYPQKNGTIPESEWLLGNPVGFRGPWGTSYPTNLRLTLSKMTEAQWVAYAKKLQVRPPMPWFNLNKMSEADLRAFYHFLR